MIIPQNLQLKRFWQQSIPDYQSPEPENASQIIIPIRGERFWQIVHAAFDINIQMVDTTYSSFWPYLNVLELPNHGVALQANRAPRIMFNDTNMFYHCEAGINLPPVYELFYDDSTLLPGQYDSPGFDVSFNPVNLPLTDKLHNVDADVAIGVQLYQGVSLTHVLKNIRVTIAAFDLN